jgi:magnesium chelatase subunit H
LKVFDFFRSHVLTCVYSPGDYGSMVSEVVGTGDWVSEEILGETWRGRNTYSYGRNEGDVKAAGTARPEVLDKLLTTTELVVQEIDSVEYGLSDIQGQYARPWRE